MDESTLSGAPAARTQPTTTGYITILAAASMWGMIGIFFTILHFTYGLSALSIGFLRAGGAALIMVAALLLWRRNDLRLEKRYILPFALFGLIGVALFYILNTEAVILTNVPTASVLLYTAPAFVALFAWRMWDEPLTRRKIAAIAAAFVGCALVAGAYDPNALQLNLIGVLVGIASGLTYACFTLFMKFFAMRVTPWTTVTYSLLFGTLFLLPLQLIDIPGFGATGIQGMQGEPLAWLTLLGLCLGPTLGSYALFNYGLRTVPASVASIIATIEPVVAAVAGFVFFGQLLEPLQLLGAVIIIGAAASLTVWGK